MGIRSLPGKQEGVVGLVVLGLIVVAIAVAAFLFVARAQDTARTDATASQAVCDNDVC